MRHSFSCHFNKMTYLTHFCMPHVVCFIFKSVHVTSVGLRSMGQNMLSSGSCLRTKCPALSLLNAKVSLFFCHVSKSKPLN